MSFSTSPSPPARARMSTQSYAKPAASQDLRSPMRGPSDWVPSSETMEARASRSTFGLEHVSPTIDPWMLEGRWLHKGEARGVVVNNDLLESEPGLSLGDTVRIKVGDRTLTFQILGVTSNHLSGPRIYMDTRTFGGLTNRANQVDMLRVRVNPDRISSRAVQESFACMIETPFQNGGLKG